VILAGEIVEPAPTNLGGLQFKPLLTSRLGFWSGLL
jgi:hypothetical protein